MQNIIRCLILVSIISFCGAAIAGKDDETTQTKEQAAIEVLENYGDGWLSWEAQNLRQGRPTGSFMLDGDTWKYILIIMKMTIIIAIGGSGLS